MDMFLSREPTTDNNNSTTDGTVVAAAAAATSTVSSEPEQSDVDPNGNPIAATSEQPEQAETTERGHTLQGPTPPDDPKNKDVEDPANADNWLLNFFTSPVSSPQESFLDPAVTGIGVICPSINHQLGVPSG